ncbi:serine hydrolase domain-containing protein [Streptomyces naphthomycinicus]|uniref:serine hydrolase domain-containing protein n=1 Tax=Streptomyces naphthomycinicus TaxID=2872625 RepID=UPI001CED46D8|nr:serine hydrolase domain-containing protein [Streptomyces sp. TML10]
MPRIPTCVLSDAGPPRVTGGHAVDRYVEIGSLTKALTGTLLARMAQAGVVGLDDPVERWLPAPPGTGVTLLNLARHTSGLPRLPPRLGRRDPYAAFGPDELLVLVRGLDTLVVRPPGDEEYSNLGYAVLGAALSAAGGAGYEELLRTYVLRPADVTEVTAHPPAGRRLTAPGRLPGTRRRPWTMDGAILPAGGLWATPCAVADLVVRLLLERRLGEPSVSWQSAGPLRWHNGATGDASVFAGATADGRWVVVHRLNGRPEQTDEAGIEVLKRER